MIERTGALPAGWPSDVMAGAQLLGDLFVGALKAVAPVLVLVLVMAAIAQHEHGTETNIRPILVLYLVGTFAAALVAVLPWALVVVTDSACLPSARPAGSGRPGEGDGYGRAQQQGCTLPDCGRFPLSQGCGSR